MANDDWSELIGLRRAAISLLWRSIICLIIWAALYWLVTPLVAQAPMAVSIMAVMCIVLAVPGVAIGHALSKDLTETAGMSGPVIAIMGCAFAFAVAFGGGALAEIFRPLDGWHSYLLKGAVAAFAMVWIAKATWFDD